ncbi:MFS transporter-like protein [Phaeosphaeria sp. MPI-PUGE-AT-0046c]|nr:MFS transporter-like protein [Phaeosphaeria sp. MPI-PUGE-AT-0046c]
MGLGILQDHALDQVPGTALVLATDEQQRQIEQNVANGRRALKYDRTGTILLVPQPSDDPNDPLNWSIRRRDLATFILSLAAIFATTLSPILAANTVSLALFFGRDLTSMALLTGYHLLAVGLAGLLFVPSARIWGKRHIYLLSMVLIVVSSAWGGATGPRYTSFLLARVMQGVGLAPFEALVNASVGDMYCVHERGVRMAVSNFCVFGGAFFTPVIVGVISSTLGYEWSFYLVAIFTGAMLPAVYFLVPETTFVREEGWGVDSLGNLVGVEMSKKAGTESGIREEQEQLGENKVPASTDSDDHHAPAASTTTYPPFTFRSSIALFNGRKSTEPFLRLFLRPFALFLHPATVWACLIQGVLIGFTVLIGIVLAAIMLGPPLWFGELETGYLYTGAFIGALLGFALTGLLADSSATFLTRLNHGVYEPEFRLVLVIPQLVFGGAGLIGFGITANDAGRYGWFWPDFFFALVVLGMVCGAVGAALYIVDAHRDIAVEAFTCLLVFKNIFAFALTFRGFDWIVQAGRKGQGVQGVFIWCGVAQIAVCMLTVPMYVLGKKNRSFFFRHNVFFKASDWVADRLTFW